MFRRACLSVKPNVRPGAGARASTAPNSQREQEPPRLQEPATASAPKPLESTDVPPVDFGEAEPQDKTPKSSVEKTDDGKDVEESINQEAPQPNPVPTKGKQPCSDRYRIYKAQKLREMLKEELRKEKKQWKNKARIEIKNKFKCEEKTNGWRIDKAFQEKRPFDFDFFAHLLQKVLAEEEKRKQKSVKNQSSKEKKSSKSRKNVKVKKVANDDRDESVSTKISNSGRSQKDAQTVEEELQSLTLSEQDSEQNALELDVNQKKRRRKNQGEGSEQEMHFSGSATVQPGSSKGEKHKNKGLSLSPEINENESSKEQELPCVQDTDDLVGLSSSEDAEKRTDPILSSSQKYVSDSR
ncbi:hypothetical protein MJG53_001160 [Ovis ammon polii x Ovis aries]|uniref:Uncharacterized protein n=1 Tax=Ovis ammon polii x Ovis aries TaxID=2918886 RepID=A0ACB9VK51_9CETA|nr:hypothetical protein MJT46_000656 [Ovis ammon polii x Ovis aries]KAI4590111.1 hypothetical protein MJG53_001160 [Ovis ammon polii x Ovis aries]